MVSVSGGLIRIVFALFSVPATAALTEHPLLAKRQPVSVVDTNSMAINIPLPRASYQIDIYAQVVRKPSVSVSPFVPPPPEILLQQDVNGRQLKRRIVTRNVSIMINAKTRGQVFNAWLNTPPLNGSIPMINTLRGISGP